MNDERLRYKLWKEKLSSLQAQHARDDSDLALASELWATYDGGPGNNVKSIPLAIGAFRGSAIISDAGSHALASAVREVNLLTGQLPRRQDFETALYWAISKSYRATPDENVLWLLNAIGEA
jgi:hypothetical protein